MRAAGLKALLRYWILLGMLYEVFHEESSTAAARCE